MGIIKKENNQSEIIEVKYKTVSKYVISDIDDEAIYEAIRPERATVGSAAYDLHYCGPDFTLRSGETVIVGTGLHIELPSNICGLVLSRSGLSARNGVFVLNAPGLIDSDYRGEIKVILHNISKQDFDIKYGDRIAQILFVENKTVSWIMSERLGSTDRGDSGLGSTGI